MNRCGDEAEIGPSARAATDGSRDDARGCEACLWPFGPDLEERYVFGRLHVLCKNPWQCAYRYAVLAEESRIRWFDHG